MLSLAYHYMLTAIVKYEMLVTVFMTIFVSCSCLQCIWTFLAFFPHLFIKANQICNTLVF